MYRTACVMALVAMCAGLAHSFSWEIVRGVGHQMEFIDINGTISHTEIMTSKRNLKINYDPIHNRVLFTDLHSIFSFDITTKKTENLMRITNVTVTGLAYDPATELLFWVEDLSEIYSITLKPNSDKNKVNEKHYILSKQSEYNFISEIAVDSCGGFIYYRAHYKIDKVRFDGSEKEVVIDNGHHIKSIAIDQHAQKLYFSDTMGTIKSADLNGKNLRTINVPTQYAYFLTLSKDFMYWRSFNYENNTYTIMQIPKNSPRGIVVEPKPFIGRAEAGWWYMTANININDIIPQEIQNCDNLKSLLPNNSVSTDVSLLCVHGTKVDGESRCECAQGYSGERCDGSVCHNYCLYGDCSTSADGQPKCRCNAGYSGERCEVEACQGYCLNDGICSLSEDSKPVCQCSGDYEGDRCNVSVCQGYCLHGDCSTSADGQPKCSCYAGYSGDRCEVNSCLGYCLNDGLCSLSEKGKPLCRCTGHYEGERCDVPLFQTKCFQAISLLKDILNTEDALNTRWKHLKDQYRKELKKQLAHRSGSESDLWKSTWQYFDIMSFFKDEVMAAPPRININENEIVLQTVNLKTQSDLQSANEMIESVSSPLSQPVPVGSSASLSSSRKSTNTRVDMLEIEKKKLLSMQTRIKDSQQDEKLKNDEDFLFLKSALPSIKKL